MKGIEHDYIIEDDMVDPKYYCAFDRKVIKNAMNKKYKKGEKKLLKIIVKDRETGHQKCIDIPKERENDNDIKNLKAGMIVVYQEEVGMKPEVVKIVKIVDDRPTTPPPYWTPYPRQKGLGYLQARCLVNYPRGAGKVTFSKKFLEERIKQNEEIEARKEYRDKPYFLVRLDPVKGQPDGKENLDKIKFPCWVVYKYFVTGKHRIGMLVTGSPGTGFEYQLIDMMEQVPVNEVCTVFRGKDLKKLLDKFYSVEVVKGESQLWKVGKFDV